MYEVGREAQEIKGDSAGNLEQRREGEKGKTSNFAEERGILLRTGQARKKKGCFASSTTRRVAVPPFCRNCN